MGESMTATVGTNTLSSEEDLNCVRWNIVYHHDSFRDKKRIEYRAVSFQAKKKATRLKQYIAVMTHVRKLTIILVLGVVSEGLSGILHKGTFKYRKVLWRAVLLVWPLY